MIILSLEPLTAYRSYPPEEMIARAQSFYEEIRRRRSVRDFSDKPVPREVVELALLAAGTAPSGANLQPWHFSVITDPENSGASGKLLRWKSATSTMGEPLRNGSTP